MSVIEARGFGYKPLLVGEVNPYGSRPKYALYPEPERATGDRLCRLVMGLEHDDYLERFDRANLCTGKWSAPAARSRAIDLIVEVGHHPIVLLGVKVAGAFGVDKAPFQVIRHYIAGAAPRTVVVLPHPSGLCRAWNVPGAFDRARAVLREAGVL